MAFFNYVTKEITLKVVYYGPGLSGKTTNLQYLYSVLDPTSRGKFISLATESDRTLFFDFLPVELGKIKDFSVRFQLYTVPGQIRYNATRKLVLKGADAVVFVADSQKDMREQNIESFSNMRENLLSNNLDPDSIPIILQFNKRDLPNALSVEELNRDLNAKGYQTIETVAVDGKGVEETFRLITKILLKDMVRRHKVEAPAMVEEAFSAAPEKTAPLAAPVLMQPQVAEEARVSAEPLEAGEEVVSAAEPEKALPVSGSVVSQPQAAEEQKVERAPEEPHKRETVFPTEKIVSLKVPDEAVFEIRSPRTPRKALGPQKMTAAVEAEAPAYPKEKIDALAALLPEIKETLSGINQSLNLLSSAMKESGRQQADMVRLLKDMNHTLAETGRKRRWFHF